MFCFDETRACAIKAEPALSAPLNDISRCVRSTWRLLRSAQLAACATRPP